MGLGDIKGIVEIIDRTIGSQSFNQWMEREKLTKKTDKKHLSRGLKKILRDSGVTKGQF